MRHGHAEGEGKGGEDDQALFAVKLHGIILAKTSHHKDAKEHEEQRLLRGGQDLLMQEESDYRGNRERQSCQSRESKTENQK